MTVSSPWNVGRNLSPRRISAWFRGRKRHSTLMLHSEIGSVILENCAGTDLREQTGNFAIQRRQVEGLYRRAIWKVLECRKHLLLGKAGKFLCSDFHLRIKLMKNNFPPEIYFRCCCCFVSAGCARWRSISRWCCEGCCAQFIADAEARVRSAARTAPLRVARSSQTTSYLASMVLCWTLNKDRSRRTNHAYSIPVGLYFNIQCYKELLV